ncbi:MAG: hypothetical protein QM692_01390 [Thermomicrobiales bacterium]
MLDPLMDKRGFAVAGGRGDQGDGRKPRLIHLIDQAIAQDGA